VTPVDREYVEARRVLLDALTALAPHSPARRGTCSGGLSPRRRRRSRGRALHRGRLPRRRSDGAGADPAIEAAMSGLRALDQAWKHRAGIWAASSVTGESLYCPSRPDRARGIRDSRKTGRSSWPPTHGVRRFAGRTWTEPARSRKLGTLAMAAPERSNLNRISSPMCRSSTSRTLFGIAILPSR
jgi:hypothetical protein